MFIKKTLTLLLALFLAIPSFSQDKDGVVAKWLNASGDGQIMIYKKGDKYVGRLVWLKEPYDEDGKPKKDSKNPNATLKSRPLLGTEILKDFVYLGDGIWDQGFIYDPKTGKTYSSKMTMINNNRLSIRGYVGISLLGRTEIWQRVQ